MKNNNILYIYMLLFSLFIISVSLIRPHHNWDMIPYAAAAKSIAIKDPSALHSYIYTGLREYVGEEKYKALIHGTYRGSVSKDPESLTQQIPFYKTRILYILLIAVCSAAGLNVFLSTYLITALCTCAGLWLIFLSLKNRINIYLLALLPLIAWSMGLLKLSAYSTPDGLSFFAACLLIYLALRGSRLAALAAPFLILVRTDLILFSVPVLIFIIVEKKEYLAPASASIILSVILYALVSKLAGNYGMETVLYNTFVEPVAYPVSAGASFSFTDYINAIGKGYKNLLFRRTFMIYILMSLGLIAFFLTEKGKLLMRDLFCRRLFIMMVISFSYFIVHFTLFPLAEKRFFMAMFLVTVSALLYAVTGAVTRKK